MTWTDEALRAAYRDRTAPRSDRTGCPPAGALARLATGEASPAERDEVADHVADCSACAEELQAARRARPDFADAERPGVSAGDGPRRPPRQRFWLAAAAALVAALLLPFGLRDSGDPEDALRSGPEAAVRPSADAALAEAPTELTWPALPGATGYRVRLYDQRARPVWESERLTEPRARLPRAVIEALQGPEDAAFVWEVEIAGGARGELGPFWFTVRGSPRSPR